MEALGGSEGGWSGEVVLLHGNEGLIVEKERLGSYRASPDRGNFAA